MRSISNLPPGTSKAVFGMDALSIGTCQYADGMSMHEKNLAPFISSTMSLILGIRILVSNRDIIQLAIVNNKSHRIITLF